MERKLCGPAVLGWASLLLLKKSKGNMKTTPVPVWNLCA